MSVSSVGSPLPEEVLKKICHHIACIYKDALPNKAAYDCFMAIAQRASLRFAQQAILNQKYAAGGIGIKISAMEGENMQRVIYYSVLADMTNPAKFQQMFNSCSLTHMPSNQQQQVLVSAIIDSMTQQTIVELAVE